MPTTIQENNKRIAKNTLMLYVRMLFLMLVGLYTSRLNLRVLGVDDFGIFNVIGGTVVMFSVVSRSLSSAISRFITYEIGKENEERLKLVFSTSVNIQILLSIVIILLAETVGLWFLNTKMVIPAERMTAANWVFQFSLVSFVFTVLSIPYNAELIGHERMSAFAYFSIIEAVGKVAIAWGTSYSTYDKLIVFAFLYALIAILLRLAYGLYCRSHFEECRYHFVFDKSLFRQMTGYASWNFIGSTSALLRDTGGNVVINLFYGPVVNAARGISHQVYVAVNGFVTNFMIALNPQITKSYARGESEYMMRLIYQGARLSFYMLLCLSLPILINTQYILNIWLSNPPAHTALFVQLILVFALTESLSNPLITANNATGKIRNYQLVVGGLQLLNLPIAYFSLRYGAAPEMVVVIAIILSQVCLFARIYMLRPQIGLQAKLFLKKVYLNILVVSVVSFLVPYIINLRFDDSLIKFLLITLLTVTYTLTVIYYVGCDKDERRFVVRQVVKVKNRVLTR